MKTSSYLQKLHNIQLFIKNPNQAYKKQGMYFLKYQKNNQWHPDSFAYIRHLPVTWLWKLVAVSLLCHQGRDIGQSQSKVSFHLHDKSNCIFSSKTLRLHVFRAFDMNYVSNWSHLNDMTRYVYIVAVFVKGRVFPPQNVYFYIKCP